MHDDTMLLLFQHLDVHFRELRSTIELVDQTARSLSLNIVTVLFFTAVICLCSNQYTYKASECKCIIISTSKSSVWYMGYVPRGGAHASIVQIYTVQVRYKV